MKNRSNEGATYKGDDLTTRQVAEKLACNLRLIQRRTRKLFPRKTGHRRFTENEFEQIKASLVKRPVRPYIKRK